MERWLDEAWDTMGELLIAQNKSVEDYVTAKNDTLQCDLRRESYLKPPPLISPNTTSKNIHENTSETFFLPDEPSHPKNNENKHRHDDLSNNSSERHTKLQVLEGDNEVIPDLDSVSVNSVSINSLFDGDEFSVTMTSPIHSPTRISSEILLNPYDDSSQPRLDKSQNQNIVH